jgi:hypothetical protein
MEAAGELVSAALAGALPAVEALEVAAESARPGWAATPRPIRADDANLMAIVAEMIEPRA